MEFEQVKAYYAKKSRVRKANIPLERRIGNVDYRTLTQAAGKNITLSLPAEKAALFADMGIFYSGIIKNNERVLITFK